MRQFTEEEYARKIASFHAYEQNYGKYDFIKYAAELTEILPKIAPEIEAVHDGTSVGFYRFKSGKYEGITYTYAGLRFEEQDDGLLHVIFNPLVMQDKKGNAAKNAEEFEEFKKTTGDILIKIIEASIADD